MKKQIYKITLWMILVISLTWIWATGPQATGLESDPDDTGSETAEKFFMEDFVSPESIAGFAWTTRYYANPAFIYNKFAPYLVSIELNQRPERTEQELSSIASGFLIDEGGVFVTDNGQIDAFLDVDNQLDTNVQLKALVQGIDGLQDIELIGRDIESNLAFFRLLNVPARKLPGFVELTPAARPGVGELVYAISYAVMPAVKGTFTSGFVTSIDSPFCMENSGEGQVFTCNAYVSKTSCGGMLVDAYGELRGVTSSLMMSNLTDRLSHFYPVEMIAAAYQRVLNHAFPEVWCGMNWLTDSAYGKLQATYSLRDGVYISEVKRDGPAYVAGLRPADIITDLDGRRVSSTGDLLAGLGGKQVGEKTQFSIYRSNLGREMTIDLYLDAYPGVANYE